MLGFDSLNRASTCPLAKKRKSEESIEDASSSKVSKIENPSDVKTRKNNNKENKVVQSSNNVLHVEAVQEDSQSQDPSHSGENSHVEDIKTEIPDAAPVEIKTEPQEVLDCFKETEQALKRLSSAENDDNITYSVEVISAGSETVFVKHEVDEEMTATDDVSSVISEEQTKEKHAHEETGDVLIKIEERCAQIQSSESLRKQTQSEQMDTSSEHSWNISSLSNAGNVASVINDGDKSAESQPAEIIGMINNYSQVIKEEEISGTDVKVSDLVKVVPNPDVEDEDDADDGDENEYMVLAEWTDGKEETLPPGEKENMKSVDSDLTSKGNSGPKVIKLSSCSLLN